MIEKAWGVFSGINSVQDTLNPEHYFFPPLVQIPDSLNPFTNERVDIFASCAYRNHDNIKMLAAWNMLYEATISGELRGKHTVVESTSGNMGLALGAIARFYGLDVKIIITSDIAPWRLETLRHAVGPAKLEFVDSGAIEKAKGYGLRPGFFHVNQYANHANPRATERWLAPVVWRQTQEKITVCAAALGTTGTAIGMSNFFKKKDAKVVIVGCYLMNDKAVPGVRTLRRLQEVSLPWQEHIHPSNRVEVDVGESYQNAFALSRLAGLRVGPSSGLAFAGLLRWIWQQLNNNTIEAYRNKEGRVVAVFPCPDGSGSYLEKFSTFCDPEYYRL